MNLIVVGNIIALIGSVLMVGIGFVKKKSNILIGQCFQFGIMGVANLVLGGITGFVSNAVSIVRNLICYKRAFTLPFKIVFILIQVVLSATMNTMGLIGWLPIAAACLYTWFLDTKSEVVLKLVMIIGLISWAVYDITLKNYVSFLFDVFSIISTIIGIVMVKKGKEKEEKK